MKVTVIYGSVRKNRQGIKAALFVVNKLKERNHEVTLLDPAETELPLMDKMFKEYDKGDAPEKLAEISKILNESDGYIIVSGEYNHGVPPALKNTLDYFQKEYFFKPAGIVTYSAGPFGGVRAGSNLRAILGELGMATISTMFPVSKVQDSFDENGKAIDEAYNSRIKKFLDEFEWYLHALAEKRKQGTPY